MTVTREHSDQPSLSVLKVMWWSYKDRGVGPGRTWRKQPLKGDSDVQPKHGTRGRDLRIHNNHANLPPVRAMKAALITASRVIGKTPSFRGAPPSGASPESITTIGGYGFRACAQEGASRNDGDQNWKYRNSSRCHMPNREMAKANAVNSAHAAPGRQRSAPRLSGAQRYSR